jgi:hypothetical protein
MQANLPPCCSESPTASSESRGVLSALSATTTPIGALRVAPGTITTQSTCGARTHVETGLSPMKASAWKAVHPGSGQRKTENVILERTQDAVNAYGTLKDTLE